TLEKMCELGVARLTPLFSDYSFVKTQEKLSPSRWARWEKIIINASQQSGRGHLLTLEPVQKLKNNLEAFNPSSDEQGLFLYEGSAFAALREHLQSQFASSLKPPREIRIYVGSE